MNDKKKYKLVLSKNSIGMEKATEINKKNIIHYFNLCLLKVIKEKINLFYPEISNFNLDLFFFLS